MNQGWLRWCCFQPIHFRIPKDHHIKYDCMLTWTTWLPSYRGAHMFKVGTSKKGNVHRIWTRRTQDRELCNDTWPWGGPFWRTEWSIEIVDLDRSSKKWHFAQMVGLTLSGFDLLIIPSSSVDFRSSHLSADSPGARADWNLELCLTH